MPPIADILRKPAAQRACVSVAAGLFTFLAMAFPSRWSLIPPAVMVVAYVVVTYFDKDNWAKRKFSYILTALIGINIPPSLGFEFNAPGASIVGKFVVEHQGGLSAGLIFLAGFVLLYDLALKDKLRDWFSGQIVAQVGLKPEALTIGNHNTGITIIKAKTVNMPPQRPFDDDAATQAVTGPAPTVQSPPATSSNFHTEIDQFAGYTKDGDPKVALTLLEKLWKTSQHKMDSREKYRTLANIGHALEAMENFEKAAAFYIEAETHQPLDANARAFAASADHMLGDTEKAYTKAKSIVESHSTCSFAWAVIIATSPPHMKVADVLATIPATARDEVEVLDALSTRAAREGNHEEAVRYARQALKKLPTNEHLKERIANSILSQFNGLFEDDDAELPQLSEAQTALLNEAVTILNASIEHRTLSGSVKGLARIRLNRALAYRLLNNRSAAIDDFQAACSLAPDDPGVVCQSAIYFWRNDDKQRAIKVLTQSPHSVPDPSIAYMKAGLLQERGFAEDRPELRRTLESALPYLSQATPEHRPGIIRDLCKLYARDGLCSEADKLLQKHGGEIPEIARHEIQASVLFASGDTVGAATEFLSAEALLDDSTPLSFYSHLAMAMSSTGRHAEALAVMRRYLSSDRVTPATGLAMNFALRAKDDQFVINLGKGLRANGVYDSNVVLEELKRLTQYNEVDSAVTVINDALAHVDDAMFRRELSYYLAQVSLVRRRPDLLPPLEDVLPQPDKVAVADLPHTTAVLAQAYGRKVAAEFAYAALRSRPLENDALKAIVAAVGIKSEDQAEIPCTEDITIGCAVRYKTLDDDQEQWVVIEPDPRKDQFINELSPESFIAKEMLGKRLGDKFFVRKDGIQDRQATVTAILNAAVYRTQDAVTNWEKYFPDDPVFRKIVIPKGDEDQPDFSVIFKQMDDRAEDVDRIVRTYSDNPIPIPITALAHAFDASVVDALSHIGNRRDASVRCCMGNMEERDRMIAELASAKAIVLDEVGLSTLLNIGAVDHLHLVDKPLIVTEGTLGRFQHLRDSRLHGGKMTTAKRDGQYVFHEHTPESVEAEQQRLTDFIDSVRKCCQVHGGLALAQIETAKREQLLALFERPIAESAAVAVELNGVLWTDDVAIGEIIRSEIGVGRVWTSMMLSDLVSRSQISAAEYEMYILRLVSLGYEFTPMFPNVLVLAAEKSGWDAGQRPYSKAIGWFGKADRLPAGLASILGVLLPQLWQRPPLHQQRVELTRALCRQVLLHPAGRQVLKAAVKQMARIFGIDAVNAEHCRSEVQRVLDMANDGKLHLPEW